MHRTMASCQELLPAGPRPARPWSQRPYYLLAAVNVLSLLTSLALNHRLTDSYTESVRVDREWVGRVQRYSAFSDAAGEVSAAGNDVFDTRDVATGRARVRAAVPRFADALAAARADLADHVAPDEAAPLLVRLARLDRQMERVVVEAEETLQLFGDGRRDAAGEHMAAMDRATATLGREVSGLREAVGVIQDRLFTEQLARADALCRLEYLTGAFILVVVTVVSYCGRHLAEQLSRSLQDTERQLKDLQLSEAETRSVIDSAQDCVITLDAAGAVVNFNPAAERTFGRCRADVLGRSAAGLLFPVGAGLPSGDAPPGILEGEALRADGRTFPAEVALATVERNGQRRRTAFLRDIGDRKRAEAGLREREARIRAIVTTAVDAIITIDEQGMIESVNPAAEQMFGHPPGAMVGCSVSILLPSPFRAEHAGYPRRYLARGTSTILGARRELTGQRADGTPFPLELAVSEVPIGGRRHFTGILRDVTERKRAEEDMRRARAAAEAASRAKSEFWQT